MKRADLTAVELDIKKAQIPDPRVVDEIAKALAGLRFGSVEITVHESRVTQIERKEKVRLT